MHPELTHLLARTRQLELREAATAARSSGDSPVSGTDLRPGVATRLARIARPARARRLAVRDGALRKV